MDSVHLMVNNEKYGGGMRESYICTYFCIIEYASRGTLSTPIYGIWSGSVWIHQSVDFPKIPLGKPLLSKGRDLKCLYRKYVYDGCILMRCNYIFMYTYTLQWNISKHIYVPIHIIIMFDSDPSSIQIFIDLYMYLYPMKLFL